MIPYPAPLPSPSPPSTTLTPREERKAGTGLYVYSLRALAPPLDRNLPSSLRSTSVVLLRPRLAENRPRRAASSAIARRLGSRQS
jgi:hypothetical protein